VRNPSKEVVVHGRGHERGEEEDADAPATWRSEQGIWIRLRSRLGLSVEAAGYPGPHYMEAGPSKLSGSARIPVRSWHDLPRQCLEQERIAKVTNESSIECL
jgi:hypothetical protein